MPPVAQFTLTFGLVAIPVRLLAATSSHRIGFRQIHLQDRGRVRYTKICELDEHELMPEDIVRAYEVGKDRLVPITDDDLDNLPLPTAKTIEVNGFLDLAAIPGEMYDKPYFLAPQNAGANKPYVLMREALARSGKAAVGKYALRGSENLGMIHAQGDVLVLQRLRWPDEVRSADDAAPRQSVEITDEELNGALGLIEALGDVDMQQMHDEYSRAVQELIEAKMEHKAPPRAREPEEEADVTDLMTALQRATEQARAERGEDAEVHHLAGRTPAKKAAAGKKTAAKKATAKKAAAKTSAAGKAATGKSAAGKTAAAKKAAAKKGAAKKSAAGRSGGSGKRAG
ncbi:non-homologous end joining protein Ku [Actinacidiphila acidipaludis]|uniref:Non-homologous end joining protein Ku n=1 Tax=Actinacidiphila acidipaludis TaxID=2873382 RepID=A0ABS7Q399_9ACTN|nr:Ku protein [Streptomyces acidipaludis]MBY8877633.1 Ku protein [Streptomyces acidipaludis]